MVSSTKKAALFSLYSMVHRYCHWINSRLKTVYFIISWLICLQTKLFNAIFYLDANLKNPRHVPFSILQLALKLSNDKKKLVEKLNLFKFNLEELICHTLHALLSIFVCFFGKYNSFKLEIEIDETYFKTKCAKPKLWAQWWKSLRFFGPKIWL